MSAKKKPAQGKSRVVDESAQFISNNMHKRKAMTVQDSSVNPWNLRDALMDISPHNLYEVKSTDDGDVLVINDGEAKVYAGNSAFSRNGESATPIDNYLDSASSGGNGSFVTIILLIMLIVIIAAAILS